MALLAYHGSDRVVAAFIPHQGSEGGSCFSPSAQIAACYGKQVHCCDIEKARLYQMEDLRPPE